MTKNEYMDLLKKQLSFADEDFARLLISDFEAHFADGAADGLSEEEIISHLGNIEDIVEAIPRESAGKEKKTEKTESQMKVNHLVIDAKFADVTLIPSLNGKVEVTMINKGSLLSKFTQTMVGEQKGDVFEVRVLPLLSVNNHSDMQISVSVPMHLTSVKVISNSGDLKFSKVIFQGTCTVMTANGDIDIDSCELEQFDITSASGDVVMKRSFADIKVSSASGDVTVEEGRGEKLVCNTASGDVKIDGTYHKLTVKTANGDQTIEIRDIQELNATTVNGNGHIILPNTESAKIKLSSVSGDCIVNEGGSSHQLHRNQQLIIKEGLATCNISTVNGDFVINMG